MRILQLHETVGLGLIAAALSLACSDGASSGGDGGSAGNDTAMSGSACPREDRVGSFSLELAEDYTSLRGAVSDGVAPTSIFDVVAEADGCELLLPRNLFCSESCTALTEVCAGDDICVVAPVKGSAGKVTVDGAAAELAIEPNGITFDYSSNFSEPYPGFEAGAGISLVAVGEDFEAFELSGKGVEPLSSSVSSVPVERERPTTVVWDPPAQELESSQMLLSLSVNAHGGTGAWLECTVGDTGSFEIPSALITELVDLGLSGYPRMTLTRRTVDSTTISEGCVDFEVAASITLDVEVPGLDSCSSDDDCESGETCQPELVCE